ncbi:polyadenylate-binding protein 7-like isoform X2 [Tasmannia lanceolata]|uniref:polyadenylate-binding protein 7-like isoform X2 n=1 Tax=Tasmannia lanceolata TaxID=3420 RepID=UPI004062818B
MSSMEVIPPLLSASLYVGDLHPDVTEGQLLAAFSVIGPPSSAHVCKDTVSGSSLCYGYVNYNTSLEAIRAIEKLNHTPLNGKLIRIMWSHRDQDARNSGIGNLFVKNLDESIGNVKLHDMFAKFGNILSCKVAMSQDGKSKGHGFVQFESEESAAAAIKNVNGSMVGDKQIYVGNFVKKSERMLPSPDAKYTNLYMKNLDVDLTEELLKEKFSGFGKITSLVIAKDNDGNSRRFGFVNFESSDDAKRAMDTMNGMQVGSKAIYVSRAQKRAEREQILRHQYEEQRKEQMEKYKGSNVYIKNIGDDVDDDDLREHFSQCGAITSAKIMRGNKGISKGFGFVCFSTPDEANKAVNTLHGFMFHQKPLYVAIAQKKEDRRAQLQIQYAQCMTALSRPSPALISAGYPPIYYTPPGVVPQIPPRQGLMYQPLGLRPGWGTNGLTPLTKPAFQSMPLPIIPNAPRQHRQNRGWMNGHMLSQPMQFMPHFHQTTHSLNSLKDAGKHSVAQTKYLLNGLPRKMNNKSGVLSSATSNSLGAPSQGSEMLSSMLAAASPSHQKQILGERLFPLIKKHKAFDLASKITGMLLEMDNSELLLLLESPESLAAKVEEGVQVLKISKSKVGNQDALHPNYLSAEVAVN